MLYVLRFTLFCSILYLTACTAVFDAINNASKQKEELTLNASCSEKAPLNLNYYCKPVIDYTPGSNSVSSYSLIPSFKLKNNSCTSLSIDTNTGEIKGGDLMLDLSSECSYQIQVTQGSITQTSDVITVTGTNEIQYSFTEPLVMVQKGSQAKQVSIEFSEPLPFNIELEYEFFNNQNINTPFLGYDSKNVLTIAKGMNSVDLNLSIPSSSSYSGKSFFGLTLKNLKPERNLNVLNISTYDQSDSFDIIDSGYSHACGIKNGELYCWGSNSNGQIGNGSVDSANVLLPERIETSTNWSQVSASNGHTCGIDNGELYCWGRNFYGEIGNGTSSFINDVASPEKIGTSNTWTQISAGDSHTCGINNGELFCWGRDNYGQLGNGAGSSNVTSPQKVGLSNSWSYVSSGKEFTCGINTNELYCWGSDGFGQVGNGTGNSNDVESPEKIGVLSSWTHISLGSYHVCGINSGELYCWGSDSGGKLGNGDTSTTNVESPQKIGSLSTWNSVSTGDLHTCGIRDSELYCWGRGSSGQLGDGSTESHDEPSPLKVKDFSMSTDISLGKNHTCAIESSKLYCWGDNSNGQLATGESVKNVVHEPELINISTDWMDVQAFKNYTIGINNGQLYFWGRYTTGVAGNGDPDPGTINVPQKIGLIKSWSVISGNMYTACGITEGRLFCWGFDGQGEVGNGSPSSTVTSPEQIGNSNEWSKVNVRGSSSCAINKGELYCWGADTSGALGNGSASSSIVESPEKIGSSNSWTDISGTCGINNGELYCWGPDFNGQVGNGDGSSAVVHAPEKIGTSNTWSQISSGSNHLCAINNGELFCWGKDFYGQVGNGDASSADVTAPEKIGTSNSWTQVSAGSNHTCGINNGELYCWGSDEGGALGNGSSSTEKKTSPEKIGTSNSWTMVSAGQNHTCGLKDQKLYCWGQNNNSQVQYRSETSLPLLVTQ